MRKGRFRFAAPFESRLRLVLLGLLLAALLLQVATTVVLKTTREGTERALLGPLYESLDRMQVRGGEPARQAVEIERSGGEVATRFRLEDTVHATVRQVWQRIPEVARLRLLSGESAHVRSSSDGETHWQVYRLTPDRPRVVLSVMRSFPSIGRLDELSAWYTVCQLLALGLLLLAVILVAREMAKPLERLRHVARTARENLPDAESVPEGEWDEIVDTFKATIERLKASEAHLKERFESSEVERLRLEDFNGRTIDALPQALVALDSTGIVVHSNPAARELPGLRPPRVGENASAWLKDAGPWKKLLGPSADTAGELDLCVGEETYHFGHERIALHDGGTLLLLHDRTPLRRLEALLAQRARLAALGETAAGLAHELRNAMGAIVGYARLSEKEPHSGEMAERIQTEAKAMEQMLNRFLEVARPTEPRKVELCGEELIAETLEPLRTRFEEAGIRLQWEPRTTTQLAIDPFWLRQALVNLLENALACVPRGGRVMVDSRRAEESWRVTVQDDGPGIPREMREKVLSPFVSLRPGGTGLGLALVQKVVTAHDGRVDVLESAWGGARFDLSFPCHQRTMDPALYRTPLPV